MVVIPNMLGVDDGGWPICNEGCNRFLCGFLIGRICTTERVSNGTFRSGAIHQIGSCCETAYMQQQPKFKTGRGVCKGNVSCRRQLLNLVPKTLPHGDIRINYRPDMIELFRFVNPQHTFLCVTNLLFCHSFGSANNVSWIRLVARLNFNADNAQREITDEQVKINRLGHFALGDN